MHMPDDEQRHDRLLLLAVPFTDLRTSANRNPTPEFNASSLEGLIVYLLNRDRRIPGGPAHFVVAPNLITADKASRNGLNPRSGAFSAATSYAKSAAHARISIISRGIADGEGLDGGAEGIRTGVAV
jgi:hypothetical protein